MLDLGCSGGGFVKTCLDDGCIAVGLEGSDFSQRFRRAEWGQLNNIALFTADITQPFSVVAEIEQESRLLLFDAITLWEVFEHIQEKDLCSLVDNIKKHLFPAGIVIASISSVDSVHYGVNLHQTVKSKQWWVDFFSRNGLFELPNLEGHFASQFIRGPKHGCPDSFILILSPNPSIAPKPRHQPILNKIYYLWKDSKIHQFVKKIIT